MQLLCRLSQKKDKLVIGLMSGTSADGIDAAIVRIRNSGIAAKLDLVAFRTYRYPDGFRQFLLKNSDARTARLDDITRLNMLIALFFVEAARKIANAAGLKLSEIDLIGSHGQTVQHLPQYVTLFGRPVRSTLQLGDPSVIAKLTGVATVGNFRTADIAVGGSGAPLVPYFDYVRFRSRKVSRGVLNIGGIANITIIPKNCGLAGIAAFDTGPGNMLIDSFMNRFYGKPFDTYGTTASNGKIIPEMLKKMMRTPYLKLKPPKSTGRETFGDQFAEKMISKSAHRRPEDIIATVTEFTPLTIYSGYRDFIRGTTSIDELYVSGGGIHNHYIMEGLRRYFGKIGIFTTDRIDVMPDAKEAICFALLANETITENPANAPGATGARRVTTLGAVCLP